MENLFWSNQNKIIIQRLLTISTMHTHPTTSSNLTVNISPKPRDLMNGTSDRL